MACNYYNPQFKGEILSKPNLSKYKRSLNIFIHEYNYEQLPESSSDEHSMYFNKFDHFMFLFDKLKNEPKKYWETAKSTCPTLPAIALQLLRSPPFLKKINFDRINTFTRKIEDMKLVLKNPTTSMV